MEITIEEAVKLAHAELFKRFRGLEADPPIIYHARVYPWGWLFSYDSSAFLTNKDELAYYVGNLPILFDKNDLTFELIGGVQKSVLEYMNDYATSKGYEPLPDDFSPESIVLFERTDLK